MTMFQQIVFRQILISMVVAGLAVAQAPPPQQTAPQEPALVGNLNLQDASLTEVVDQLARQGAEVLGNETVLGKPAFVLKFHSRQPGVRSTASGINADDIRWCDSFPRDGAWKPRGCGARKERSSLDNLLTEAGLESQPPR